MSVLLDVIQLICVIIIFLCYYRERKNGKERQLEIDELNRELDTLKYNIAKEEIKLSEAALKINEELLPTLKKIQVNYSISKTDKLKLLDFLVVFMTNINREIIYKVNVSRKFTFKEASDVIINYIKRPLYTDKQIVDVLDSIYYLITK